MTTKDHSFYYWWGNGSFHFLASFEGLGAFNQLRMDTTLELILPLPTRSCHFTKLQILSDYAIYLGNAPVLPAFQSFYQALSFLKVMQKNWGQVYQAV